MSGWISANLINIVLVAVIVLIVTFLIRGIIRNKKAGRSACGGSCTSCGGCGGCSACGKNVLMETEQEQCTSKKDPGAS